MHWRYVIVGILVLAKLLLIAWYWGRGEDKDDGDEGSTGIGG